MAQRLATRLARAMPEGGFADILGAAALCVLVLVLFGVPAPL